MLLHISNTNQELLAFCKQQGIQVEAYSPIAHGEALKKSGNYRNGAKVPCLCRAAVHPLCDSAWYCGTAEKRRSGAHGGSAVDFEISAQDMQQLVQMQTIQSYGKFDVFPVFRKGV